MIGKVPAILTFGVLVFSASAETAPSVTSSVVSVGNRNYTVYDYVDPATKKLRIVIPEGLKTVRGLLVNCNYAGGDSRGDRTFCHYYREFMHLHEFGLVASAGQHLSGRLMDPRGEPVRNATIEIWSVDGDGVYLADRPNQSRFDANFQGFGRFLTGSTGEYYFRTLKPVRYEGRQAPHIHFKIKRKGRMSWTTQLFIKGYPGNSRDGVYRSIGDEMARNSVTVDFAPVKDSRIGELAACFDIVLGVTAQDEHPNTNG